VTPEQRAKNVKAFEDVVKVAAYGYSPIAPPTAWYSLAPIRPTGGYWYFSSECPSCKRASPMFRDASDGHLGNPFANYGVQAVCYFCKAEFRCPSESIRSIQWPLDPGQIPPKSEYANRIARRYVDDPEYRPLHGPLHHYTSVDALLSIVKSRALWATNVRYLNDSSESELGLKLIRRIAGEARNTAAGIDFEILTQLVDWLDRPRSDAASVYVLSFSEAHNQLSQWRGYTRHGQGVCLSIDSGLLVNRMQAQGWTFQNCRYNQPSQLAWADAILSRIRREAATNYSGIEENKPNGFETVLENTLSDLLQVAATIKHDAFAREREVRFISPVIDIGDHSVRYRPGRTTRIPFVEFALAAGEDSLSIHEIMVGPGPAQHSLRLSVIDALKQNRVNGPCVLSVSEIPYREL
jgi:hypothetical protein